MTDADGDGLIDQFEQLFGTDTTKADTDGDGLSDAYETSVSHTDALSIDTNHDGITDAVEIAHGQDPGHGQIPAAVRAAGFGGLATLDSDNDGVSDLQEQKWARTRWTPTPTTTGSATVSKRPTAATRSRSTVITTA